MSNRWRLPSPKNWPADDGRDQTVTIRTANSREPRSRRTTMRADSGVLARHVEATLDAKIDLSETSAPLALCSATGELLAGSPSACAVLSKASVLVEPLPSLLPADLWALCERATYGESLDWRPALTPTMCVGVTLYPYGKGGFLMLLQDASERPQQWSAHLHKQRLELTGRLVAMIAHDLRVPLSTILFNAEMAWDGGLRPTELRTVLRDIREAADRMRGFIDGLLDFARPGGSRCSRVDLTAVLERLQSLVHPSLRDGDHGLRLHVRPDARVAHTNALLVEQVLVNLIMNAVEAADGPIGIVVRTSRVPRDLLPQAAQHVDGEHVVRMTVQDSGPGIAPELRGRVFDPFFSTKRHGTGLGLPMAREAMHTLGAALTLEDASEGARFVLWFPLADAEEHP